MPLAQGTVGPVQAADGALPTTGLRQGRLGDLLVSELHGKYHESAFRGLAFMATMTAGVALNTQAGTATTFALANPAGSGKNLSVIRFEAVITAFPGTPVAGAYGLYLNFNPIAAAVTGTALAAIPCLVGSNFQPVAKPFTAATLPANPTLARLLQTKATGASTTVPYVPQFAIDLDGTMVLTPGTTVSIQQVAADTTNASAICSIIWEEIPTV